MEEKGRIARNKPAKDYDNHRMHVQFEVGDLVMLYVYSKRPGKTSAKWSGPWQITRTRQTHPYNHVIARQGKEEHAHVQRRLKLQPAYAWLREEEEVRAPVPRSAPDPLTCHPETTETTEMK